MVYMKNKTLYWGFGIVSFLVSLITLMMTAQPTVPFWDCGEFSAASIWQEVPHPPGTPLFILFGRLFYLILPFGDLGWRVNMVSVVGGALTIYLLYFIIVKVIMNLRENPLEKLGDELAVYGSALVGALAYAFSDTFWFNSVESEVYASSTLFVALVLYLMMKWNEVADKPGNEKYLILIAYLIGLSTGVHLLAILALFSVSILVYFRKYKFEWGSFIVMGALAVFLFLFVYKGVVQWIVDFIATGAFGTIVVLLVTGGLAWATYYYGYQKKQSFIGIMAMSMFLMIFGYTTYTAILLRSNANSPMNENEPKNFTSLSRYLGREQYGDQKLWPRRTDATDPEKVRIYRSVDEKGEYIYGPWEAPTPLERTSDGEMKFEWNNPFWAEIRYMMDYQINHMYIRYFLWNFVGRASDEQDAPAAWFNSNAGENMNHLSGYADQFPVRFYAIPLLFGLLGLFFQFWKDPKLAFNFLMLFLVTGVLAAIIQNQQNPQPRERDYFYAGSFLVWCIWIGLGAYMIIDWLAESLKKKQFPAYLSACVIAVSLLAVPVNMAYGGWKIHSRADNYLAFDYAYNILQSCEPNAILFTAGDNDTFPVWFLQDVMGVRRDVRVVNLSLGNTTWYIDQLKNRSPWGAQKIPLSFPDESIKVHESDPGALSSRQGGPDNVVINVKPEIMKKYTDDPVLIKNGLMSFTFRGMDYQGDNYYRVQDLLVKDIVEQTKFERPVYFSSTAMGSDNLIGLDDYLRLEGMVYRVCPIKQEKNEKFIACDVKVMDATLLNVDNSGNYSTDFKYGFKFRNLNNPKVYYDKVQCKYMINYRRMYLTYAYHALYAQNDKAKTIKILDAMNENIGLANFPLEFGEEFILYRIYKEAGAKDKAEKFMALCEKSCNYAINNPTKLNERVSRWTELDMLQFDYKLQANLSNRVLTPYCVLVNLYKDEGRIQDMERVLNNLYNDWFTRYNNSENLRAKLMALLSDKNAQVNLTQEEQAFGQNIIFIQYAMIELKMATLGQSVGTEERIAILQSMLTKFRKDLSRDDYLRIMFGNTENLINSKIDELKPKPLTDSLTALKDSAAALEAAAKDSNSSKQN